MGPRRRNWSQPWNVILYATLVFTVSGGVCAAKPASDPLRIAHLSLSGHIREAPSNFAIMFGAPPQTTLYRFIERLKQAKDDHSIGAVLLAIDRPVIQWAQVDELRAALGRVRDAGKSVWVYIESAGRAEYALATAAQEISLSPAGMVELVGMYGQIAFYQDMLSKLRVSIDLQHIGDYKAAHEPFTRNQASEQLRSNFNWLFDSLYDHLVETVAQSRGIPANQVRATIDRGPFHALRAQQEKLVDHVEYRTQFIERLKDTLGREVEIVRDFGKRTAPQLNPDNPFALFSLLMGDAPQKIPEDKPVIAILMATGTIVSGDSRESPFGDRTIGSETLRQALRTARNDDAVKAVVMRVDSPGGSALASDVIWRALYETAQIKPVYVSMGAVAASGGYYISCPAKEIFVQPSSLTGSIGVVGGKPVVGELKKWVGISTETFVRGANADLYNLDEPFNDHQQDTIRAMMREVYRLFNDRVAQGRGNRIKDLVEVTQGRVFTGRQAVENGLADRIGGLHDAIEAAAADIGADDFEVRFLPKPKTFADLIRDSLSPETKSQALRKMVGTDIIYGDENALAKAYKLISLLHEEQVLMFMPYSIVIRP